MTRMIILAGAPEPAKLDWTEPVLLPLTQNIDFLPSSTPAESSYSSSGKGFSAQWRQIATDKLQMRPILPKLDLHQPPKAEIDNSETQFFTPSDYILQEPAGSDGSGDESPQPSGSSSVESAPEGLVEYYNHSFTIYEAVPSSSISTAYDFTPGTPVYESNEEMFLHKTQSSGGIIRTPSPRRPDEAPRPQQLTNLVDIPNASHLRSIEPQTMTVNLIVGVLSISPTRSVTINKQYGRPRQVELVELVVGDDTKTSFSVTMWLPREMHVNWKDGARATPEGTRSILRRNLKSLRIRDVVMIQNVALGSYRGKVHGQSLKGDVTKIDLLYRKKTDEDDPIGIYTPANLRNASFKDTQVLKVKTVRDWLLDFVGDGGNNARGRPKGNRRRFPYDTQ